MAYSDFKHFDERDTEFRNSKGKVKAAPELPYGTLTADTHCHLGMLEDPAFALARAAFHSVDFICCMTDPTSVVSDDDEDDRIDAQEAYASLLEWESDAAQQLETWGAAQAVMPRVRYACGVHPHNARHFEEAESILMDLLAKPQTCCLGEIGLDYHYDLSPRDVQRKVFDKQLGIASDLGLPVSLHIREAHDEALQILKSTGVPEAGCILHCFNLGPEVLEPFLELGCHVAFGGPLTFKKSWQTRRALLDVPVDRILTETDAPFMAPEPLRGTVCMPDQTIFTLRMLLDCFGYSGEERSVELVNPRANDLAAGQEGIDAEIPDLAALQKGLSQAEFAERVFQNALDLLDRERG